MVKQLRNCSQVLFNDSDSYFSTGGGWFVHISAWQDE